MSEVEGQEARRADPERAPTKAPFRRFGPFVLLAIAAGLIAYLGPVFPRDQRVRISLGALAPRVTGIDLDYITGDTRTDAEPAHAASLHYAAGQAPRIVEHTTSLPNGRCRIDVVLELANPVDRVDVSRVVSLDGNTVTLPIDAPSPPATAIVH